MMGGWCIIWYLKIECFYVFVFLCYSYWYVVVNV